MIRIGFWGPLYYNDHKEPQNSKGNAVDDIILHYPKDPKLWELWYTIE